VPTHAIARRAIPADGTNTRRSIMTYNPAIYPETVLPVEALPFCDLDIPEDVSFYIEPGAPFGDVTPWGKPDSAYQIASGIWSISTGRHGGLWLAPQWLAKMPPLLRLASFTGDEWFEEDCAATAVVMAFPEIMCEKRDLQGLNDILPERHQVHVLRSAAGYYLGRRDEDGTPLVRDSVEYWPSKRKALRALKQGTWTLRHDC
jgi:hypothetical protein